MLWKKICIFFITLVSLLFPLTLSASDFEWRLTLNLQANSDPYGYRYGLMNRFMLSEREIMSIVNRVYEPADAYMIFRFAELSGHLPEYILQVYYERRHYGWNDIAYALGIRSDRHEVIVLRQYHDMRPVYYDYNYRRKERYEERYSPVIQHHYVPKVHRHDVPVQKHHPPKPHTHEPSFHSPAPSPRAPIQSSHHQKTQNEPKKNESHQHRPPQGQDDRYEGHKKHH